MSRRKQLQLDIALNEKILLNKQVEYEQHRDYFRELSHEGGMFTLLSLLPAFLQGWQMGRLNRAHPLIQLAKLGIETTATYYKNRMVQKI